MKRRMHPPLLYVKYFICVLSVRFISSVISIAGVVMLAAPMATVQAAKPTLEKVEIESEGTHTGNSLYSYSRQYLYQDWEDNTDPARRTAARKDLVAGQRGDIILTAPGYSNPAMGLEIKVFGNTDEIVLKLTFDIDVKVQHDGTSELPALGLVFDGEKFRSPEKVTELNAVYDSARTDADTDLKVVYFTYTVQDGDNVFGDGININWLAEAYDDDDENFIIDNDEDVANPVSDTLADHKWETSANNIYSLKLQKDFYVGRLGSNDKTPTTDPFIHTGLNYQVDAKRASVRIPGLIKDGTHDVQTGYRTAYVNFAPFEAAEPNPPVTEPDTQTESFDVEFLFYNYGIGGDDDGVIADTTQGFEATDITLKVDDTAVTLGTTTADWQVSAPMLIGLDHRDPGFAPGNDDLGLVKHSSAFKVYRATITPPSAFDGNVEITVPENATMDIAGNLSQASNTLTVPVNTVVEVNIPDETLLAAIKEKLDIADDTGVTPAKMLDLTSLDLGGSDVSNLTGLEYATNLEELDLSDTQVEDISALSSLTSLLELSLSGTPIEDEDISHLSGLINLKKLDLSDTQVSDISPLAN